LFRNKWNLIEVGPLVKSDHTKDRKKQALSCFSKDKPRAERIVSLIKVVRQLDTLFPGDKIKVDGEKPSTYLFPRMFDSVRRSAPPDSLWAKKLKVQKPES
jgi:hypothetical protein